MGTFGNHLVLVEYKCWLTRAVSFLVVASLLNRSSSGIFNQVKPKVQSNERSKIGLFAIVHRVHGVVHCVHGVKQICKPVRRTDHWSVHDLSMANLKQLKGNIVSIQAKPSQKHTSLLDKHVSIDIYRWDCVIIKIMVPRAVYIPNEKFVAKLELKSDTSNINEHSITWVDCAHKKAALTWRWVNSVNQKLFAGFHNFTVLTLLSSQHQCLRWI